VVLTEVATQVVAEEDSDPVDTRGHVMKATMTRSTMIRTGRRGTRDMRTSERLTYYLPQDCPLMETQCMDFTLGNDD
jgi:hypothetical protein